MNRDLIGVQGGEGSFSEEAAKKFATENSMGKYEIKFLISSNEVLSAVESGGVDYGVFAMENAQGGVVIESVEAMAEHRCKIVNMFHVTISQNLLVKKGVLLENISEIHSHQQALRQCKDYLANNFWSCKLIESDDTAEAARRLSEGKLSTTTAVIGSKNCSKLYGLEILKEDIHDLKHNLTLFLAVKRVEG